MGGAAPVLQSRSSSLPAVQQCSRLLLRRINQELALNLFVPHHAEGSILHALLPLVIIQEKAEKWEKKTEKWGGEETQRNGKKHHFSFYSQTFYLFCSQALKQRLNTASIFFNKMSSPSCFCSAVPYTDLVWGLLETSSAGLTEVEEML